MLDVSGGGGTGIGMNSFDTAILPESFQLVHVRMMVVYPSCILLHPASCAILYHPAIPNILMAKAMETT